MNISPLHGLHKLKNRFYKKFVYISLKQLNLLAIWVVLVFIIIFSALLIHEESKAFDKRINKERKLYEKTQRETLSNMIYQFKILAEDEISNAKAIEERLQRLVCLFSLKKKHFIFIKTPKNLILCRQDDPPIDITKIDFSSENHFVIQMNALTYATPLPQGYILMAGLYEGVSHRLLEKRQLEMKSRLIRIILEIVTLAFILFGFILGINKIVNTLLEKDFNVFLDLFSNAAYSEKTINPNKTFFREFRQMVFYANNMVRTIASQKESLLKLNISLEDKVQDKTKALESKNDALEKEKEYSQELLAAQKLFIRHTIHETNTPLSVIMANLELFEMEHGTNKHLAKVEAAMKNIALIFDELSYLLKKNQISYPKHKIELVDFIRGRIDFFDEIASQSHLCFEFNSQLKRCYIYFNETKLQRIIDNTLSNAIKYTYRDEKIKITLKEENLNFILSFSSYSQQIQEPEKVFDAYYRENHYKDGFGLGLNLVKYICDEEGVDIKLTSKERLTCFTYIIKGLV